MSTLAPISDAPSQDCNRIGSLSIDTELTVDHEWLMIAHDAPEITRRLSAVAKQTSAAVMQIPQSEWNLQGTEIASMLQEATTRGELQHLMLVGHSNGLAQQTPTAKARASATSAGSRYDRLLKGVAGVNQRTERSRKHFRSQVLGLCECPALKDAFASGRLRLHALFFVAHSGTFLVLNLETGKLSPMELH